MNEFMYVVMSNDYPDAVFNDETAANIYCEGQNDAPENQLGFGGKRIYWRVYKFKINQPGQIYS
jgi:hypothetical protein